MRLINVNDADPRSMAFPIHADGGEYTPYERGYNDGVISCYGLLMNAPTIDAAEVVRCNWIPVSERLPKRGEFVLFAYAKENRNPTMYAKNTMAVGRYDQKMFLVEGCAVKVTHWMPLPEPPKEDHHET